MGCNSFNTAFSNFKPIRALNLVQYSYLATVAQMPLRPECRSSVGARGGQRETLSPPGSD